MHVLVFMLYEWYFFRKNVQFSRDEHEHEHEHEKENTPLKPPKTLSRSQPRPCHLAGSAPIASDHQIQQSMNLIADVFSVLPFLSS